MLIPLNQKQKMAIMLRAALGGVVTDEWLILHGVHHVSTIAARLRSEDGLDIRRVSRLGYRLVGPS